MEPGFWLASTLEDVKMFESGLRRNAPHSQGWLPCASQCHGMTVWPCVWVLWAVPGAVYYLVGNDSVGRLSHLCFSVLLFADALQLLSFDPLILVILLCSSRVTPQLCS